MAQIAYKHLLEQHLGILRGLQYKSGLFAASSKSVDTGYDKSWLRDNFYECLPFFVLKDYETVRKTYRALLDIFIKHEYKIRHAAEHRPKHRYEYIHARFHPETFDEFWEEWGNKQNDSVGAILFMVGILEQQNVKIIESQKDKDIINLLIKYLATLEYWKDLDSGMWEENEEVHASSVGACVAGLREIRKAGFSVPVYLIREGRHALNRLLPRESEKKFVDLALLSLIFPYNVVTNSQRDQILEHVEYHLVKRKGVIRYKNDYYYNKNEDGMSEEAEWTFGFSWLSIIYMQMKDQKRAQHYERLAVETINDKGEVPELYYSNSEQHNENSPLGWSEAMLILALYVMNKKHINVVKLLKETEHAHLLAHFDSMNARGSLSKK
ncbi:MAG: glycoside hydrolase family 15 protein [Candidatus Woesearchaeota archaeon]